MTLTQAERDAINWLWRRGGDGVVQRVKSEDSEAGGMWTAVLAAGEFAPFQWRTWYALIQSGHLEEYRKGGGRRVRLSKRARP